MRQAGRVLSRRGLQHPVYRQHDLRRLRQDRRAGDGQALAIVRQWSEKYGVTLTDADREEIAQQRAQYVSYYGSEEAYQNQLRLLGISEESFNTINEAAYYYADLAKLFCNEDGAQRPSDETLIAFAADNGYCTAKTLYVRTSGLDEAALAEKRSQLEAAAEQLRAAEDKDAAYLELAASLGIRDERQQR